LFAFGRQRRLTRSALAAIPRVEPERWQALCAILRSHATAQMVGVGERLGASELSPTDAEDLVSRDLVLALDAYAAAGKLLDEARTPPDLAGVLVLLDIAEHRHAAANARARGERPPHFPRRCYENPLHGPAAPESEHPRGGKQRSAKRAALRGVPTSQVPLCAACLHRRRAKQTPDSLVTPVTVRAKHGHVDGVPVPYYALPAAQSLWSATAFGCLPGSSDADLVARVLRGEYRTA
jgi:hypothetical protein